MAADDWGNSTNDNGWGDSTNDWGSSKKDEDSSNSKKDDGWGNSKKEEGWGNTKKDEGWGSSNKDGGWGTPKKDNNWGSSRRDDSRGTFRKGNNWGGPKKDEGWGTSKKDDDWGSSKKNDDWGSSRKNDDWGSSNKNDDWGTSKKDDDWGRSKKNDDWGSTKNDNGWGSSNNDTPRGPKNKTDDSWGSQNNEERSRKRFKREDENQDDQDQKEKPAPYKPEAIDLDEEARLQAETGANFDQYLTQSVTCLPEGTINPVDTFSDVISSQILLDNINKNNYSSMTPIQKWAIPSILSGYDLIGCAQTGSGKTAAFLLPVLQTILRMDKLDMPDPNSDCQNPYCLVISPTRELARQIYVASQILSKESIVKTQVIYGQIATAHLKAQLCRGCHVLVATPGKLKDFLERGWIGFKNLKYVILDEGDRLVDDGFSADIELFFDHPTMPPKDIRQTLFFSATFKPEVQMRAKKYLKDDFIFLTVGRVGAANESIKQEFLQIPRHEKKRELKKILNDIPPEEKTIIFTQTKQAADILAGFFSGLNLSSTSIHGDRHQSQREQAIAAFKRGEKRFLISSPVGNRGLDLPKVALVINYDLPDNIDEYVHRIGRTGRAGHTGRAISFCDIERDAEMLPQLVKILEEVKQEVPDWMRGISAPSEDNKQEGGDGQDFPAETSTADEEWN